MVKLNSTKEVKMKKEREDEMFEMPERTVDFSLKNAGKSDMKLNAGKVQWLKK